MDVESTADCQVRVGNGCLDMVNQLPIIGIQLEVLYHFGHGSQNPVYIGLRRQFF